MKQCPRCKNQLTKTQNDKLVCKCCGFVTRSLQVARDNQQFQQHHSFSKKISLIRSTAQQPMISVAKNNELKNHYMNSFQNMLRQAVNNLIKGKQQLKGLQLQVKKIWMLYVSVVVRDGVNVLGVFEAIGKDKKGKIKVNEKEAQQCENMGSKKEEEEQEDNLKKQLKQKSQQKQQEQQKSSNIEHFPHRRRGRPKKMLIQTISTTEHRPPIILQLKRKLSSLHELELQKQIDPMQIRQQFIKYLYHLQCNDNQFDLKLLTFAANKYVQMLAKQLGAVGLSAGKIKSNGVWKVGKGEIFEIAGIRGLGVMGDKVEAILVLLLEGLLSEWSSQLGLDRSHSFQNLLLLYSSQNNTLSKPLISLTILHLQSHIQQSNTTTSKLSSPESLPELSYTLLYAIIYLASASTGYFLSINDVVLGCGKFSILHKGEKVNRQTRITNQKIRKMAKILAGRVGIFGGVGEAVQRFVGRQIRACGLQAFSKQILMLSQTIMKAYISKNGLKMHSQFIEQDIISKAIIIMFIKLEIGLQKYPYLSTVNSRVLKSISKLKNCSNKNKYMQVIVKILDSKRNISVADVIGQLSNERGAQSNRAANLRAFLKCGSYTDIEHLNCKQLTDIAKQSLPHGFYGIPHLPYAQAPPLQPMLSITTPLSHSKLKLSKIFEQQLQLAAEQLQKQSFDIADLDLPSSNYEFFYQYFSNIAHSNRELFVALVCRIAGTQCRPKDVFSWLEKLQKALVLFEC